MTESRGPLSPGLSIVGTPIGNLSDLSDRGREALQSCDVIVCEDTRRSGRLLQQLGLAKRPFLVANEYTEGKATAAVIERIKGGQRVVLITDAGMPGVSDPGSGLIKGVIASGLAVDVVPGPTALISGLVLSGLPTTRFVFEGFLARRGQEREVQLGDIASQPRTTVFYESPKRVVRTLQDLAKVCGADRQVALARELTKLHEQVVRGTIEEVESHFADVAPRGEFVVIVAGRNAPPGASDEEIRTWLDEALRAGLSKRDAVSQVVERSGVAKNRVYHLMTADLVGPEALQ